MISHHRTHTSGESDSVNAISLRGRHSLPGVLVTCPEELKSTHVAAAFFARNKRSAPHPRRVEHSSGTPSPGVGSHPPPRGNSRRGTERRTATGGLPRSEKAGPSHTRASDKNLGFKNAGHPAVRRAPRRHVDPGGVEGVPHRPAGSRSRRRPAVPEDCREDAQAMPVRRCVSRTAHASPVIGNLPIGTRISLGTRGVETAMERLTSDRIAAGSALNGAFVYYKNIWRGFRTARRSPHPPGARLGNPRSTRSLTRYPLDSTTQSPPSRAVPRR